LKNGRLRRNVLSVSLVDYLPKMCKKAGFKIEKEKKFNLGMLHAVKVRKV